MEDNSKTTRAVDSPNYSFSISEIDPDYEIDFQDLQPAVAMQSSLYGYYSEKAADARAERDSAINALKRMEGEVELEIRKKADESKQKLTIPEVTAKVAADPRLAEQRRVIVEKTREFLKLDGKVNALDQKRSMIECAVRMTMSRSNSLSRTGVFDDWTANKSQDEIRASLNRQD